MNKKNILGHVIALTPFALTLASMYLYGGEHFRNIITMIGIAVIAALWVVTSAALMASRE